MISTSKAYASPPPFGVETVDIAPFAPIECARLERGRCGIRLYAFRAENFLDVESLESSDSKSFYDSSSECFTSLNFIVAEQILVSATIHAAQYLYTATQSWIHFCCREKTNFGDK